MATAEQIIEVRLNIDDLDSNDFDDTTISNLIDQNNSVNYASYKCIEILIVRLRKKILKSDTTGVEKTDFHSLREQLEILQYIADEYKEKYEDEIENSTGKYISTVKPCIGDI